MKLLSFLLGLAFSLTTMKTTFSSEVNSHAPLLGELTSLFDSVSDRDFERLATLCDDDFGIVDLDAEGKNVLLRTRAEWEAWFQRLFAQLPAMGASTYTHITSYQVLPTAEMVMSVAEFIQYLEFDEQRHPFECVVTVVWKRVDQRWIEARWHISLIKRHPPELVGVKGS
jgi:SnoaL-like domain